MFFTCGARQSRLWGKFLLNYGGMNKASYLYFATIAIYPWISASSMAATHSSLFLHPSPLCRQALQAPSSQIPQELLRKLERMFASARQHKWSSERSMAAQQELLKQHSYELSPLALHELNHFFFARYMQNQGLTPPPYTQPKPSESPGTAIPAPTLHSTTEVTRKNIHKRGDTDGLETNTYIPRPAWGHELEPSFINRTEIHLRWPDHSPFGSRALRILWPRFVRDSGEIPQAVKLYQSSAKELWILLQEGYLLHYRIPSALAEAQLERSLFVPSQAKNLVFAAAHELLLLYDDSPPLMIRWSERGSQQISVQSHAVTGTQWQARSFGEKNLSLWNDREILLLVNSDNKYWRSVARLALPKALSAHKLIDVQALPGGKLLLIDNEGNNYFLYRKEGKYQVETVS